MNSGKKYLLISMEDERAKKLADVLGNKTCKKIIDLLAEKESSEDEISKELKVPLNTIEYNLKKLLQAEIVEKSKKFLWSKKGKKINFYKLSNKSIIISPKSKISSKIKSILPAAIMSLVGAIGIRYYYIENSRNVVQDSILKSAEIFTEESGSIFTTAQPFPVWGWFLVGGIFALTIFTILNWRKI